MNNKKRRRFNILLLGIWVFSATLVLLRVIPKFFAGTNDVFDDVATPLYLAIVSIYIYRVVTNK